MSLPGNEPHIFFEFISIHSKSLPNFSKEKSAPVYVPCEALDAYLNSAQWKYFTNIQCDDSEGIEDREVLDGISVYPNPTSGEITIVAEGVERVEVMNMLGRKVAEFKGALMNDLSELESGVYVLRIVTNDGTAIRRVIKK